MKKYLSLKQRKSKILSYIRANPLCTTREIADNHLSRKSNYRSVNRLINELLKENKIGKIFSSRPYYFDHPSIGKEKDTLIKILRSKKVTKNRFKKMHFRNQINQDDPLFVQIVAQGICLFHLYFKISKIKNRKSLKSTNPTKKFLKLLELYSYKKIHVEGGYIGKRDKNKTFVKNPSQERILIWLSDYICALYYIKKREFNGLKSGKTTMRKKINLMQTVLNTSLRDAADSKQTSLKNIHKIIGPLMDSDRFKTGEVLKEIVQGMQTERIGIDNKSLNTTLSNLLFNNIKKVKDNTVRYSYSPSLDKITLDEPLRSRLIDLLDIS